jgi:8-oxo-dGTP pyrophosphatase MutT (NUDIX family)
MTMMNSQPSLSLAQVERALRVPLPGYAAQERMATRPRLVLAGAPDAQPPVQAAVLLALFARDGRVWLPLTRRSEQVAHHRGQISFPGGARETGDDDLWGTALREAEEELGLDTVSARQIGLLTPLYIPSSHFQVHPYVAELPAAPMYRPDGREVAEVIELPLDVLLDPAVKHEELRTLHDTQVWVPFYRYGEHVIWGATAMMLSELEVLLDLAGLAR